MIQEREQVTRRPQEVTRRPQEVSVVLSCSSEHGPAKGGAKGRGKSDLQQSDESGGESRAAECAASDGKTAPNTPRLAALADVLADIPEEDRRGIVADLNADDRIAIAKMLVARLASGEGRPA